MNYKISVIILTYNSTLNDTKKTILSIINQKNISFEIIIADDGSKENNFELIKSFFDEISFSNYQLIGNKKNNGTCLNLYNAILKAQGEYIKPISPQDFLYDDKTLYNWYNYVKKNNIKVSFGNAVYYKNDNNQFTVLSRKNTQPIQNELYDIKKYKKNEILVDNLILNDCILGASFICQKEVLEKYLTFIIGKIRLCEDFAYRIMLLDDIRVYMYNSPVIYYCFGTGVSSKKKSNGKSILYEDEIAFRDIISEMKFDEFYKKKIVKFYKHNFSSRYMNRLISFIYFPMGLKLILKSKIGIKLGKKKTEIKVDYNFLKKIGL